MWNSFYLFIYLFILGQVDQHKHVQHMYNTKHRYYKLNIKRRISAKQAVRVATQYAPAPPAVGTLRPTSSP